LIAKRLELLRELVPGVALIGVLMNTDNPNVEINTRDLQAAARATGQQILIVGASSKRGFDAAFTTLAKQKAGALFISPDAFFQSRRVEIVILSTHHAIPTISSTREFAEAGGLASYGASQLWASQQAGVYMGKPQNYKPGPPAPQPSSTLILLMNLASFCQNLRQDSHGLY
jgi:putative tryptophan/tyrosine transport system substrate-binding protein